MKKALIPILVSCALMVGCGGTQVPAETETLVEETVIEETVIEETVIDETTAEESTVEESATEDVSFVNENANGWSCDMLNYSEVPEDIQEMIRNYGSGDYENSVFLGSGTGHVADNVVTYAVMINIDDADQVLYINVDESGEPSYELAEDYQTAFDEIVGVVAAESEVSETEASESLVDETEA